MALNLNDKETNRLAREVAALTGERLERERLRRGGSDAGSFALDLDNGPPLP